MKVHKITPDHAPTLDAIAGPALDAFVMDPQDLDRQQAVANQFRLALAAIGFPPDQPVTRGHVGRVLRLVGVDDGMIRQFAPDITDLLATLG